MNSMGKKRIDAIVRMTGPSRSTIRQALVPVSFIGLPAICKQVWSTMKSVGTKHFTTVLATENNYALFVKMMMYLAEAKLTHAHICCGTVVVEPPISPVPLCEILHVSKALAYRLPYPLALYLDAIGYFSVDGQKVVPVLARSLSDERLSGALNFAPSSLVPLIQALRTPVPLDDPTFVAVGTVLSDWLPNIDWDYTLDTNGERTAVKASDATLEFWNTPIPTAADITVFREIIFCMEFEKDFLVSCDITTGAGSSVQVVRFPDRLDASSDNVYYYMNTLVPKFEEKIAAAFMLGLDYGIKPHSRFVTGYEDCLKHGRTPRKGVIYGILCAR